MSHTVPSTTPGITTGGTPKKAALASFLGSAVEYYDFFIFGSAAALIFPHVFFPDADTNAAIMSFATFGFAYIARPVGAVVLGHFGDRIGRRKVLMFTLLLMGASTFAIGCLPDFKTVGWWAPVLLVLARLCQGFSAAGEQAGASSMTLEHAPDNRRSFFTSWTLTGTQGGQILAALVFIPVLALPDDIKYTHRLAHPVLAQRRGGAGRVLHPPHPARTAGVRGSPEDQADLQAPRRRPPQEPLARCPARHRLRLHRRRVHRLRHPGHQLRQERRRRGRHHHPLARRRRQLHGPGHPAALRHARRQDRPQAGLHLRRTVQRSPDPGLPAEPRVRQRSR